MYIPNTKYEVLTDNGFKKFNGIQKTFNITITLTFSDNSILECTYNHKLKLKDGTFAIAKDMRLGDELSTGISLVSIEYNNKTVPTYDLINVADTHSYITNNVVSSNCAFVENWDEFYASVYPTIASGKSTKILFSSTPKGINHFYKFIEDAKKDKSDPSHNKFAWVEVPWHRVPGRDDEWKLDTLSGMNFDYDKFEVEFNCQFAGSSGTLISGSALKSLVHQKPIYEQECFYQYVAPKENHSYVIICDVSRGKGLDYSAFQVIDVTKIPFVQVATYRNNAISPTNYAMVINRIGILYNNAYVLVEINDIGAQVADLLFEDFDYENLLYTCTPNKTINKTTSTKTLSFGGEKTAECGIRTTKTIKNRGCTVLKLLIEQQQLIINDFNTIQELSRFSKRGNSYEAESDAHDDLVMGLVLFAWASSQPAFADINNIMTIRELGDEDDSWDNITPFGFINDGHDDDEPIITMDSLEQWCM